MTHEELLAKIDYYLVPTEKLTGDDRIRNSAIGFMKALRAVVELHQPNMRNGCDICSWIINGFVSYEVCPTIQAIQKELQMASKRGKLPKAKSLFKKTAWRRTRTVKQSERWGKITITKKDDGGQIHD